MQPRQGLVVLMLSMLPGVSFAQDCGSLREGSTARAGCVAHESFQREDKALNLVYRKLEAAMNKPEWMEVRKKLVASQKTGVSYREKECQFVNDLAGGAGGVNAMDYRANMTKERTVYLSRVLEQFK